METVEISDYSGFKRVIKNFAEELWRARTLAETTTRLTYELTFAKHPIIDDCVQCDIRMQTDGGHALWVARALGKDAEMAFLRGLTSLRQNLLMFAQGKNTSQEADYGFAQAA
ncbi:MAG: hypothetical protein AB7P04_10165 [Bacteriovoracia bacterium]